MRKKNPFYRELLPLFISITFSKAEIIQFDLFLLGLFKWLRFQMYRVSFDMNRPERPYRTDVFTPSASDTNIRIYMRNGQTVFERYHCYGLSRTMLRTSSAARFIRIDNTILYQKNNSSYLGRMFLFDS